MIDTTGSMANIIGELAGPTRALIPGGMVAAGIALLSFWLLLRLRRRAREINRRSETTQASFQTAGRTASPRRDLLDNAMVQVQELTRECAAQIDNRVRRLEHLLRTVDERIRELEDRTAASTHTSTPPLRFHPASTHAQPIPQPQVDPLTRRVHELADQGRSPVDIARQLDEPTGKIELILALRHASAS